eukprot:6199754-Pleurochrysis_carterae.AAC.2
MLARSENIFHQPALPVLIAELSFCAPSRACPFHRRSAPPAQQKTFTPSHTVGPYKRNDLIAANAEISHLLVRPQPTSVRPLSPARPRACRCRPATSRARRPRSFARSCPMTPTSSPSR